MINYSALRERYIEELEQLPYGEGVLVLPNSALQNAVKLHHMVKCIGLDSLAMEINNAAGMVQYELVTRQAQELILNNILERYKKDLQYFQNLADKPGLTDALLNFFTELRRCHVDEVSELAEKFTIWKENKCGMDADVGLVAVPEKKNYDIVLLYGAYLAYLRKHNLFDLEGQYSLAIANIEFAEKLPYKKIYISDMPFLNQLQKEFVAALGNRVVTAPENVFEFKSDFKKELARTARDKQKIVFEKYGSHRDELAAAFLAIKVLLQQGVDSGKIAVAVSGLRNFPGINSLAKEYGIPITLPDKVKLALQPLFMDAVAKLEGTGTVAEFKEQLENYLDSLELEKNLGAEYKQQSISLAEMQTTLSARKEILSCAEDVIRAYTLSGMGKEKISAFAYKNVLQDMASKVSLTMSKGILQGVTVAEQISIVGGSYDYLFILGMNDGEFPPPVRENWIYTDRERLFLSSIGFRLPLAGERFNDNALTFLMLLDSCQGTVVCSWMEEDAAAQCSYCDELLRLCNADVEDKRGQVIPHFAKAVLTATEIKERVSVDVKRAEGQQEYLGVIGQQDMPSPVTFRATALEKYAGCPFAYMLSELWHLDTYGEDEDELSPATDGNLMHKTLEIYFAEYKKKYHNQAGQALLYSEIGEDKDKVFELLQQEFDRAFAEALEDLKRDNEITPVQEQQLAKTILILHKWFKNDFAVQWEEKQFRPYQTEKNFNDVKLWDGDVCFKGRIDRMDVAYDEKGKFAKLKVIDYKRSSVPDKKVDLQIGIYQLVAEQNYKFDVREDETVVTGAYYSIKNCKAEERPVQKVEFVGKLKNYTEGIRQGNFDLRNKAACSPYCAFRTICRNGLLKAEVNEDGE